MKNLIKLILVMAMVISPSAVFADLPGGKEPPGIKETELGYEAIPLLSQADADFEDLHAYYDWASRNGITELRTFCVFDFDDWGSANKIYPFKTYGGKFYLDTPNPDYFVRVTEMARLSAENEKGITTSFVLFDHCGITYLSGFLDTPYNPELCQTSPFTMTTAAQEAYEQGREGRADGALCLENFCDVYENPSVADVHARLCQWMVDATHDYLDNVAFEMFNEPSQMDGYDGYDEQKTTDFQLWVIEQIKAAAAGWGYTGNVKFILSRNDTNSARLFDNTDIDIISSHGAGPNASDLLDAYYRGTGPGKQSKEFWFSSDGAGDYNKDHAEDTYKIIEENLKDMPKVGCFSVLPKDSIDMPDSNRPSANLMNFFKPLTLFKNKKPKPSLYLGGSAEYPEIHVTKVSCGGANKTLITELFVIDSGGTYQIKLGENLYFTYSPEPWTGDEVLIREIPGDFQYAGVKIGGTYFAIDRNGNPATIRLRKEQGIGR